MRTLTGIIYKDNNTAPFIAEYQMNYALRAIGLDWPQHADTMIGLARMENTMFALQDTIAHGVNGDFLEAGVWRGGTCILALATFEHYAETALRRVWVLDSFAGLPEANTRDFPQDKGDNHHTYDVLAVDVGMVQANFKKYGFDVGSPLYRDRVVFVKGFFNDSVPPLAASPTITALSILRVDGDMYESTWLPLRDLYPKLSVGGYVICDDVQLPMSLRAVVDYRRLLGLQGDVLHTTDTDGAYWRRSALPERLGYGPLTDTTSPAARLRWPLRIQLTRASLTTVSVVMPLLPCTDANGEPARYSDATLLDMAAFVTAVHAALNVSVAVLVPMHACVYDNSVVFNATVAAVGSQLPAGGQLHATAVPDDSATAYNLGRSMDALMHALQLHRFDIVLAMGSVTASDAASQSVCQLLVDTTHGPVHPSAYRVEYIDAKWQLLISAHSSACDAAKLAVARRLPVRGSIGEGRQDGARRRMRKASSVITAPLVQPRLLDYSTCAVVSVRVTGDVTLPQLEINTARQIEDALRSLRTPLHVTVVPVASASTQHDAFDWIGNLKRVYGAHNVSFTHAAASDGEAWSVGINNALLTTMSRCDVFVLLADDAVIDHTIVHATDAAADHHMGPVLPLTNAPTRFAAESVLYTTRSDWLRNYALTPEDWDDNVLSAACQPMDAAVVYHANGDLDYDAVNVTVDPRVMVLSAETLTHNVVGDVYFRSSGSVDYRQDWLARWATQCGQQRGSVSHSVITTSMVWHDTIPLAVQGTEGSGANAQYRRFPETAPVEL